MLKITAVQKHMQRSANGIDTHTMVLQLKAYMEKYMPPLKVPVEAAEAFINQRPTSSMKVSHISVSDLFCNIL